MVFMKWYHYLLIATGVYLVAKPKPDKKAPLIPDDKFAPLEENFSKTSLTKRAKK